MRKVALFLCTLCQLNFGQAQQTSFGMKGGINISTVTLPHNSLAKWRSGIHAGPFMRVSLPGKLFIQPELLYSLKGHKFEASQYNPKGSVAMHYITLPLLAGFRVSKYLSLVAGPEMGYLLSTRMKSGGESELISAFKEFDYGLDLGATYKVNEAIGIDLRYNHGLRKLAFVELFDQPGPARSVSHRTFQLGIHYLFSRQ